MFYCLKTIAMYTKQHMQNNISGKEIVITGASSGVGRAAAETFSAAGCKVVLVALGQHGIDEVVDICTNLGVVAIGISADVSVAKDVEKIAEKTLEHFGRIDVWVNNAGVMANGKFEEIPMEIHEQVIKTNLFGYMHGAYNAIKIFKEQQYGILINNISIGGMMRAPFSAVYSSSKYGIKGMMEGLRAEVSNHNNIHICNIYPQLQNSTGNLHSAKYSGFKMGISPLASDPRLTAQTMLELAADPKSDVYADFSSRLITTIYRIFPKPFSYAAFAFVRMMMNFQKGPDVEGNILQQSKEPLRIYGNPELQNHSSFKKKVLIGAGVGFALALLIKSNKRQ